MTTPIEFKSGDIDERIKDTLIRMEGYVVGYRDGIKDGWNDCIDALKQLKNDKVIFRKLEEGNERSKR